MEALAFLLLGPLYSCSSHRKGQNSFCFTLFN